jgi:ABC-type antimicrobial peptide transport system permease subunit
MQRAGVTLVIRAKDPARLTYALRQAVWAEDPAQPVAAVRLMRDIVDASLADRRLTMLLLAFFAALAVLLATIGIYGVVAYVVGQRTREIGIRIALGAERPAIRGMVVKHAMRLAAAGVALGLAAAFALSRILETQLYAVSPRDPAVFVGTATGILLIALAASYLPALRASRIEPATALRRE